ncbi:MAG: hypothetical protein VXZ72_05265 [Chlamydiota bacterium]|nr:hypothetical protein [Chlamydiota bacterium]
MLPYLGNMIDHYDKALYGALAPYLAITLSPSDPLWGLVSTYCLLPVTWLARPIGAWLWGSLARRYDHVAILRWTLGGMGLVTLGMGALPLAQNQPTICLLSWGGMKALQQLFSAGESPASTLLAMEKGSAQERPFRGAINGSAAMIGVLLAFSGVALLHQIDYMESGWRGLYVVGGLLSLLLAKGRVKRIERQSPKATSLYPLFTSSFFCIVALSALSYAIYELATHLMYALGCASFSFTWRQSSQHQLFFLVLDILLLPFFGWIGMKVGVRRCILSALVLIFCLSPFLFLALSSSLHPLIIRSLFTLLGTSLSAPLYAFYHAISPPRDRLKIIAMGVAIGGHGLGSFMTLIALASYRSYGSYMIPSLYLVLLAGLALYSTYSLNRKEGSFIPARVQ